MVVHTLQIQQICYDAVWQKATLSKGMATMAKDMATKAKGTATKAKGMATKAKGMATKAKGMATTAKCTATKAKGMATKAKHMAIKAKCTATKAKGMATKAKHMAIKAKCTASKAKGMATTAHGNRHDYHGRRHSYHGKRYGYHRCLAMHVAHHVNKLNTLAASACFWHMWPTGVRHSDIMTSHWATTAKATRHGHTAHPTCNGPKHFRILLHNHTWWWSLLYSATAVPWETAAILARSVYTMQPCTMLLHENSPNGPAETWTSDLLITTRAL